MTLRVPALGVFQQSPLDHDVGLRSHRQLGQQIWEAGSNLDPDLPFTPDQHKDLEGNIETLPGQDQQGLHQEPFSGVYFITEGVSANILTFTLGTQPFSHCDATSRHSWPSQDLHLQLQILEQTCHTSTLPIQMLTSRIRSCI